ncbi:MAG TPA: helix-turn-helix transcriptional regulator [Alphaproteobacteria bacterium]|nr:helix-turn-helix transcriptional regulator [Alphaproteobacteria bacterium]
MSMHNPALLSLAARDASELLKLSSRQLEALHLLACGYTNVQIGERMGISARTVECHLEHSRRILGASCRSKMIAMAVHMGLDLCSSGGAEAQDAAIRVACDVFRQRLQVITRSTDWRHPNLCAVAERLRRIEEELLLWARNQRLAAAEVVETTEEAVDAENAF